MPFNVTKGGVIFSGGTKDRYLHASDLRSGKELWRGRLPSDSHATPMTYVSPKSGRQFVVIASGPSSYYDIGGGPPFAYVVAYALLRTQPASP